MTAGDLAARVGGAEHQRDVLRFGKVDRPGDRGTGKVEGRHEAGAGEPRVIRRDPEALQARRLRLVDRSHFVAVLRVGGEHRGASAAQSAEVLGVAAQTDRSGCARTSSRLGAARKAAMRAWRSTLVPSARWTSKRGPSWSMWTPSNPASSTACTY